jgi:hypothetical protein
LPFNMYVIGMLPIMPGMLNSDSSAPVLLVIRADKVSSAPSFACDQQRLRDEKRGMQMMPPVFGNLMPLSAGF